MAEKNYRVVRWIRGWAIVERVVFVGIEQFWGFKVQHNIDRAQLTTMIARWANVTEHHN